MKVVQISTTADFLQFTAPLIRALALAGHDVHVVSSPGEALTKIASVSGVTAHAVQMARGIDLIRDAWSLPRLISLFARIQPDIVHAHTPKAGLLGMLAARAAQVRGRVYHTHGLRYETSLGARRQLLQATEKTSARLAHRVICVSHSVRDQALRDGTIEANKSCVMGRGSAAGIEVEQYDENDWVFAGDQLRTELKFPREALCVLYAGRLARDKGLEDLQRAWALVREKHPDAQLLLAGERDVTDPVNVESLRAHRGVHFLGKVEETRPLFALCDVFVLPSFREGLPQGILEAGAMARPVVAAKVTGSVDAVIHRKTGILVPPHRPTELAHAISELLSRPELRREMGAAGHQFVRTTFQREPIIEQTLELYRSLLK